ncbi:hypothetical protein T492DRAFT_1088572, partial [Pavlovales sp. CCMP2436]
MLVSSALQLAFMALEARILSPRRMRAARSRIPASSLKKARELRAEDASRVRTMGLFMLVSAIGSAILLVFSAYMLASAILKLRLEDARIGAEEAREIAEAARKRLEQARAEEARAEEARAEEACAEEGTGVAASSLAANRRLAAAREEAWQALLAQSAASRHAEEARKRFENDAFEENDALALFMRAMPCYRASMPCYRALRRRSPLVRRAFMPCYRALRRRSLLVRRAMPCHRALRRRSPLVRRAFMPCYQLQLGSCAVLHQPQPRSANRARLSGHTGIAQTAEKRQGSHRQQRAGMQRRRAIAPRSVRRLRTTVSIAPSMKRRRRESAPRRRTSAPRRRRRRRGRFCAGMQRRHASAPTRRGRRRVRGCESSSSVSEQSATRRSVR